MNEYIEQHQNIHLNIAFITDDQVLQYALSMYTFHNLINIQLEKKIIFIQ